MAEKQLPLGVTKRAIELASGLSRPRIRGLIANGTLRQMVGGLGLVETESVIETFGEEIKARLAGVLAESFAKRQRAGLKASRRPRKGRKVPKASKVAI